MSPVAALEITSDEITQPCPVCGSQVVTNTAGCSALCDAVLAVRSEIRERARASFIPICERVADEFEVDHLKLASAVLKAISAETEHLAAFCIRGAA
jgi:predicted nucleic acid-binding Zn ribbon protein